MLIEEDSLHKSCFFINCFLCVGGAGAGGEGFPTHCRLKFREDLAHELKKKGGSN